MKSRARLFFGVLTGLVIATGAGRLMPSAFAGKKPEDVFKGQVVVTKKRLPSKFSSGEAFISAIKQSKTDKIWPKEQKGNDDATWKVEYVAFFARPLDDFEVMVKFYDVTGGTRRYVAGDAQMTRERGTRVFASDMELSKPEFDANRKYLMVLESHGRTVAQTTFWLRGKGEEYSGKVEFSDGEAK
ncbi:MAG: hypothetical protein KA712_22050 [Myxococcales bacterium]|nr:hypothetical protein [Myxococcales bacterium]